MAGRAPNRNNYGPMRMEKSPARKKREAAGRRRQDKRWAAKSGEVCQGSWEFPTVDHRFSPPVIALRRVLMASWWARMR